VKTWPTLEYDKPTLLGLAAFKAGTIHVFTVDDRERTPNFGKPLFNTATVLEAPPVFISGFRAYTDEGGALTIIDEVYAKNQPKYLSRLKKIRQASLERHLEHIRRALDKVARFTAVCCIQPNEAGLSQKTPILFEVGVGGGSIEAQLEYLKSMLGKTVKPSDVFKPGMYIDTVSVTKGKGFEGPVTRLGIKRKQHKSRKSVRAVGALGAWHPAAVMYTVPRAGQRGLHRRTEYNKRIIAIGDPRNSPITPPGGFPHYGVVKSDYIIVKGSVAGPVKRLVKLRYAVRAQYKKVQLPKILEISTVRSRRSL